jgi:hypothetical protein
LCVIFDIVPGPIYSDIYDISSEVKFLLLGISRCALFGEIVQIPCCEAGDLRQTHYLSTSEAGAVMGCDLASAAPAPILIFCHF